MQYFCACGTWKTSSMKGSGRVRCSRAKTPAEAASTREKASREGDTGREEGEGMLLLFGEYFLA